MQCEMCGKDVPRTRRTIVERIEMQLCAECAKFGKDATPEARKSENLRQSVGDRLQQRQKRMGAKDALEKGEQELVSDYGQRIQRARQKKGWSREQLADKVGQPVPTIAKIESNDLHPSDRAVKNFEKELGITLMETVEKDYIPRHGAAPSRGLTLGDLIKDAQKKNK